MSPRVNFYLPIFLLLIVVVISYGLSFSRYTSTLANSGEESTVISVNKYNLYALWQTPTYGLQYPGMSPQSYDFTIVNGFEDDATPTEELSYTVRISMNWNAATPVVGLKVPLNMELYKVNPDASLTLVNTTPTGGLSLNRISTQEASILVGQEIDFRLIWDWGTTAADLDCRFAYYEIDVQIEVKAEQTVDQP